MAESVAGVLTAAAGIMTLHPGDVVTCGSPNDGPVEIHPGDEVAVEIERIGRLVVRVEAGT
jgi:5-oxopent-3-ene-1,2,5-tricarboxylate decarboxylase/2-hydroxyhepta-2,4-diene-1,7-dioate isomerase